jgi:hypothetical protein
MTIAISAAAHGGAGGISDPAGAAQFPSGRDRDAVPIYCRYCRLAQIPASENYVAITVVSWGVIEAGPVDSRQVIAYLESDDEAQWRK